MALLLLQPSLNKKPAGVSQQVSFAPPPNGHWQLVAVSSSILEGGGEAGGPGTLQQVVRAGGPLLLQPCDRHPTR